MSFVEFDRWPRFSWLPPAEHETQYLIYDIDININEAITSIFISDDQYLIRSRYLSLLSGYHPLKFMIHAITNYTFSSRLKLDIFLKKHLLYLVDIIIISHVFTVCTCWKIWFNTNWKKIEIYIYFFFFFFISKFQVFRRSHNTLLT